MKKTTEQAQKNLSEVQLRSQKVFTGKLLQVYRDEVSLPNGHTSAREYIRHPGAVVILAMTDEGQVVLERQYRYPLQRDFIELPAGKIDSGEDDLSCAKRELLEETGYTAREWQYVTTLYPCIGYADERLVYYLARGLTQMGHAPDEDEFLEIFHLPLQDALNQIHSGHINEAKTVAGLFWLEKILQQNWQATPPGD